MTLEESVDEGLAAALKKISPSLCEDIDAILAQGGEIEDVMRVVERVRRGMKRPKPLHTNTVEELIEGYARVALRKK